VSVQIELCIMTASTKTRNTNMPQNLRPLEMRHDLRAVADLIQLCFAPTLDADGYRYIRQMRSAARNPRAMSVAGRVTPGFHGFVWEEKDKIVGNLSLLPVVAEGRRSYFIANVAVHPDYRRRGIARSLTEAAFLFIRERGISSVWLHVNEGNMDAIHLYQSFGFKERACRTTWHSTPNAPTIDLPTSVSVRPQRTTDWQNQNQWLERAYPKEIRWHFPLHPKLLKPGFQGIFNRFFSDKIIQQWSVTKNGELVGSISWQSSYSQADWLWLAVSPQHEALAILSLLSHARKSLRKHRTLAVDYPAGETASAFESVGFHPHKTLIWMHTTI
jgi:ribosomal protein S18 acetylase RimI-like enzyme